MLKFLSTGDVQVLIARHHDRLTRNAEDFDRFMKISGKAKIKISLYTGGELDLSTAGGGFYGFMETGRSWYEWAIRSQRVKDAVERNARSGKRTGGGSRPFGYKIIRPDLGESAPRRWRIVGEELEPTEAEAIKEAATRVAATAGGCRNSAPGGEASRPPSRLSRWCGPPVAVIPDVWLPTLVILGLAAITLAARRKGCNSDAGIRRLLSPRG
jgi:hypothetical protein